MAISKAKTGTTILAYHWWYQVVVANRHYRSPVILPPAPCSAKPASAGKLLTMVPAEGFTAVYRVSARS